MIGMKEKASLGGESAEQLIPLLQEQVVLYRQLQRLSQRQRELISRDDSQALLVLLAERQSIVETLGILQERMNPLQQYWRMNFGLIPPEIRRRAEGILQEISEALRGIMAEDEQDSRMLAARKSQTAREMMTVTVSQQANRAYGPPLMSGANPNRTDESV